MRNQRAFVAAVLMATFALALLTGCGSMAQIRLAGDPKMHPDAGVVFAYVCSGEQDAARLYLESPTFAWIGPVKERYLTDAKMRKFAGDCPCAGRECPAAKGGN